MTDVHTNIALQRKSLIVGALTGFHIIQAKTNRFMLVVAQKRHLNSLHFFGFPTRPWIALRYVEC